MPVARVLLKEWTMPVLNVAVVGGAVVVVAVTAARLYRRYKRYQSLPGNPASEFSWIYGNMHLLPKSAPKRLEYGLSQMRSYNFKFHRFWLTSLIPIVTTYHPDTVKKVLQSSAPKSRGFGSGYQMILSWIGEGLIATNGERWVRSRRLLTPAFHFDILKDYMEVYNEAATNLFKKMDKLADNGESFDLYPMAILVTLESILKCALSYDVDVQGAGHPYAQAVADLTHLFGERARRPWLFPDWIFRLSSIGREFNKNCDYVHRVAEEIINKRRETLERHGVVKNRRRMDFIDLLLTAKDEDGQTMTNLEIRNEVDTFMFAGHDTTASAIGWCLTCLAKHPEYQEWIQEELDNFLEGRDNDDIKWEDLSHLEMLAVCLKESMRLYAPVPFIQRQINEDMELEGHVIPVGSLVNVSIYCLHRNPTVWDEPEKFRPERFLIENKKLLDPHAFVPFSSGSRNCIGQNFALNEVKVTVARILRRFKVELCTDHEFPTQKASAILRPHNGMWLRVKRR